MIDDWVGHHHRGPHSPLSHAPAALKLSVALAIIIITVLAPGTWLSWFAGAGIFLALVILISRLPLLFLLKRLALLSPFVLGVALLNAFQPVPGASWWNVAVRSTICLITVVLVSNTTPFSSILRVLKLAHVPSLLVTTLALMHRYLFVLTDEAERMRRARASRTFNRRRGARWRALATIVGQLFIRGSERAERIYDAMCARGWK